MNKKEMETATLQIAQDEMRVDTLTTRHNDYQDFYSLAVWEIKKALEEAYVAGYEQCSDKVDNCHCSNEKGSE